VLESVNFFLGGKKCQKIVNIGVKAKKTKMRNVKLQHKWRHNKYEVA
jgi:hypothetical protein